MIRGRRGGQAGCPGDHNWARWSSFSSRRLDRSRRVCVPASKGGWDSGRRLGRFRPRGTACRIGAPDPAGERVLSWLDLGPSSACGDGFCPSCPPAVPGRAHRGARRHSGQASVRARRSSGGEDRLVSLGPLPVAHSSRKLNSSQKPHSQLWPSHVAEGGREARPRANSVPDACPQLGAHAMPWPREPPRSLPASSAF